MQLQVVDHNRPDLGGNIRHGDIHTWCPRLWQFLVQRFAARSVLDVGCGEGHAVRFFHDLGVFVHGIDGLRTNIARAVAPIALHDLSLSAYHMPVDLVWSSEVAEHITPDHVNNYIVTLVNGRVVVMTHALPGQYGYHHVNCQPADYWIGLMQAHGYRLSEDLDIFKTIAAREETWNYFQATGLVFVKD